MYSQTLVGPVETANVAQFSSAEHEALLVQGSAGFASVNGQVKLILLVFDLLPSSVPHLTAPTSQ